MKTLKQLLTSYPEYILIALVIFYWTSTIAFNPIAIGLITILIVQIIVKNRILGLVIGCLFVLLTLYFMLAWGSELFEFPVFNTDAKQMFFYGFLILGVTSFATGLMIYKHLLNDRNTSSNKS